MHQLSLHYTASYEINSTWLAQILLLIFCLLFLVCLSLMSCSIQTGYVPYGVLVSSFSPLLFSAINCSMSQTGPVKQRNWKFWMWATTSLWSFHRGQQTFFLYRAERSSVVSWLGREKQCYSSCFIPCCAEIQSTFSVQRRKYSVFKCWKELTSKSASWITEAR